MPVMRRVIVALVAAIGLLWNTPAAALATPANRGRQLGSTEEFHGSDVVKAAIIAAVLAAIATLIVAITTFIMRRNRKQRENERWERLDLKATQYGYRLTELRAWATRRHPEVMEYANRANDFLRGVHASLKLDNLDDAADRLKDAEYNLDKAWGAAIVAAGHANEAFCVKRPTGSIAPISWLSHEPEPTDSDGHPYYYGGGFYGNVQWPAGYYNEPFWKWEYLGPFAQIQGNEHGRGTSNSMATEDNA